LSSVSSARRSLTLIAWHASIPVGRRPRNRATREATPVSSSTRGDACIEQHARRRLYRAAREATPVSSSARGDACIEQHARRRLYRAAREATPVSSSTRGDACIEQRAQHARHACIPLGRRRPRRQASTRLGARKQSARRGISRVRDEAAEVEEVVRLVECCGAEADERR
jgi:hypothetical protein